MIETGVMMTSNQWFEIIYLLKRIERPGTVYVHSYFIGFTFACDSAYVARIDFSTFPDDLKVQAYITPPCKP